MQIKEYQRAFSLKLLKERLKKGLTQRELVQKLHWTQDGISRFEARGHMLQLDRYIQYCEALDLEPVKLLQEVEAEIQRRE